MRKPGLLTAAAALVAVMGFSGTAKAEVFFPFDTDLVAYWPFDDQNFPTEDAAPAGTETDDGSFNGGAAYQGGVDLPPVAPNTDALELDGSGDFVDASDSADLDQASSFTVAAWVKLAGDSQANKVYNVVSKDVSASVSSTNYNLHVTNGNSVAEITFNSVLLVISFTGGGADVETIASGEAGCAANFCFLDGASAFVDGTHPLGTWRHVAGVFNAVAGTMKVYLDGALDGEVELEDTDGSFVLTRTPLTNDSAVQIGKRKFIGNDLSGLIDEVRIYDRALNEDEIAKLHSSVAVFKELVDAIDLDSTDTTLDLKENWEFEMKVTVANNTDQDLTAIEVVDPLPGDLELGDGSSGSGTACPDGTPSPLDPSVGVVSTVAKGKSDKCKITWDSFTLDPGDTATLTIIVSTDVNPAGIRKSAAGEGDALERFQEYTSEGTHCINRGATLMGTLSTDGTIVVQSNGLEVTTGDTLPDDVAFVTHDDCG